MLRNIYKRIRSGMSPEMKSRMTKAIYTLSGKPYYFKDNIPKNKKFPNGEKGGMILSADFELAWAFRYSKEFDDPYQSSLVKAHQARSNFPELIRLFDQYKVPITWATVGHLFLTECSENTHDGIRRLPYFHNRCWIYDKGDWFDHDPHTDYKTDPEWYAPDLIQMILDADVEHELGTHTFSHVDFSDKNCPPEVADDEISASIDVMQQYDLRPYSICFPSGSFGNTKVLKKHHFKIYRKKLKKDVVAYPWRDELGLIVTPTSDSFGRQHETWSVDYYAQRYINSIKKAVKTGTVAHFMFHPSMDEWTLYNVMPKVLEYAAKLQETNKLWIGTMNNIADHINEKKIL